MHEVLNHLYLTQNEVNHVEWIIVRSNYAPNTSFCQIGQFWILWKSLSCEPCVHVYSRFILENSKLIHKVWMVPKAKNFGKLGILGLLDTAAYFLSNNLLDLFTIFSRKYAKVNCVWYTQRERIYKLYISSVNAYYYFNACKVNPIT